MKKTNSILIVSILTSLFLCVTIFSGTRVFSKPSFNGMFDLSEYVYSTVTEDRKSTETNYRPYGSLLLDIQFNDKFSFHTNDRIVYRGLEIEKDGNEDPEKLDLNAYYGYFNYKLNQKINIQLGRIMDINNLVYSYYDGLNVRFTADMGNKKFWTNVYGGLLVNDNYLDDEETIYGFNSFDVRNFYIEQRTGDYISGAKVNFLLKKVFVFSIDYQMTMNESSLAEQYVSLDFDTFFSERIKLYGFGSFDVIEKKPSTTLAGIRVSPFKLISLSVEHEYYRPVFIKDSFWWLYYEPLGHQSINGILLFFFSPIVTLETKYSRLIYEGEDEQGDEVSVTLEDRSILGFGISLTGEYLKGPEGEKRTGIGSIKRRFFNFVDISAGGGMVQFTEDPESSELSSGYVARGALGIRILNRLIISADAEYFNNPKYLYDIRTLISVKYIF